MKKKLFFALAFFISIFLLFAWQIAAAELADLQAEQPAQPTKSSSELVSGHF